MRYTRVYGIHMHVRMAAMRRNRHGVYALPVRLCITVRGAGMLCPYNEMITMMKDFTFSRNIMLWGAAGSMRFFSPFFAYSPFGPYFPDMR